MVIALELTQALSLLAGRAGPIPRSMCSVLSNVAAGVLFLALEEQAGKAGW